MDCRDFFNQAADGWDDLLTQDRVSRLKQIVNGLGINRGSAVLDVGSGNGVLLPILQQAMSGEGSIVTIDISEKMLQKARAKGSDHIVNHLQADACALPLITATFDFVICYSSFPHFNDKPAALRELYRVLKKGGLIAISHTASREEINELHRNIGGVVKDHIIPQEKDLRQMLQQAGFVAVEIRDRRDSYLATARKP